MRKTRPTECALKRARVEASSSALPTVTLLRHYYPHVLTLREYLASRLSNGSKKRSRRLLRYGSSDDNSEADESVVNLLDNIYVGCFDHCNVADYERIEGDISVFTQQVEQSDATISLTQGAFQQSEVGRSVACWPSLDDNLDPSTSSRKQALTLHADHRLRHLVSFPATAHLATAISHFVPWVPTYSIPGRRRGTRVCARNPWHSHQLRQSSCTDAEEISVVPTTQHNWTQG